MHVKLLGLLLHAIDCCDCMHQNPSRRAALFWSSELIYAMQLSSKKSVEHRSLKRYLCIGCAFLNQHTPVVT